MEPPVLRTLSCLLWARARSGRCVVARRASQAQNLPEMMRKLAD